MSGSAKPIIFYDGHCALCHGFVKFTLKHDKDEIFSFAPLQGETFNASASAEKRAVLPDSIVFLDKEGQLFVFWPAVYRILLQLGPLWKSVARVLNILPLSLLNAAYRAVASVRKKILGTKEEVCPMLPEEFRKRILP